MNAWGGLVWAGIGIGAVEYAGEDERGEGEEQEMVSEKVEVLGQAP